jgi:dTDP-4-amino-4,6-dideoxygalactose transaminase
MKVPFQDFHQPYAELKEGLDAAYRRFMESGWFVLGNETSAFESEYADYCGSAHAVGVANGLEALHLALLAIDVKPGDEVIVPSNTYIATWLAVSQIGAIPVPVEPDVHTFNLDPVKIEAAISKRTKVILAVNLYGQPCDYDQILQIARSHDLKVVIDNAQAHGARYKDRVVGGLADIECHSFYPSKNLGAYGEAGAVTTNDPDLAEKVRVLRNYGSRVRYHNEVVGFNSRIDELQAAFLRVKLQKLDEWNERRRKIAALYDAGLSGQASLGLPIVPDWATPVWHLYVLKHPKRDELQKHLAGLGIQTLIHYPIPPHLSCAYQTWRVEHSDIDLPVAEHLAGCILSLPIGPHLCEDQARGVVEGILGFPDL